MVTLVAHMNVYDTSTVYTNVYVHATPIIRARRSGTQGNLRSSSLKCIRVSTATGLELK